jgi:hypothetical protein
MMKSYLKLKYQKLVSVIRRLINQVIGWLVLLYFVIAIILALWYFMGNSFFHHYYFFSDAGFVHTISLFKQLICWQ